MWNSLYDCLKNITIRVFLSLNILFYQISIQVSRLITHDMYLSYSSLIWCQQPKAENKTRQELA